MLCVDAGPRVSLSSEDLLLLIVAVDVAVAVAFAVAGQAGFETRLRYK